MAFRERRPAGDVAGDVAGAAELGPGHVCRGVAWGAAGGMLMRSALKPQRFDLFIYNVNKGTVFWYSLRKIILSIIPFQNYTSVP